MRHAHWAGAVLSLAAVVACGTDSPRNIVSPRFSASGGSSGPSASGHANWLNGLGQEVHRSFHARDTDGVVEGNFVQHNTVTGVDAKGDIDCMRFLAPNEVELSGPVREHTDPALVGRTAIFRVADNGEGSKDPPDRMSGLNIQGALSKLNCRTFVNPFFTPIESGNIQVKP